MASPPRYASGPHGLRPSTPIVVGGVIVLAAVLVLGTLLVSGTIGGRSPATPGTTVTAPAVPDVSAAPTTAPAAPATAAAPVPLPGFGAEAVTGGSPAGVPSAITAVRTGAHEGYDRFVVELGGDPLQQYEVRPQAAPTFTRDPRGDAVTLEGSRGVLVVLRGASNHVAFSGPTDLFPALPAIREARLTGDFEGVVSWALGVNGPGFVRVQTLTSPSRLVVDVQT
jgi:hypothetical protein